MSSINQGSDEFNDRIIKLENEKWEREQKHMEVRNNRL